MNQAYIEFTIQRISTKYGCLQANNQKYFQPFTESSKNLNINLSYLEDSSITQEKVPCLSSTNKNRNEIYDWPQISTIIISPKSNSQSKQDTNSRAQKIKKYTLQ